MLYVKRIKGQKNMNQAVDGYLKLFSSLKSHAKFFLYCTISRQISKAFTTIWIFRLRWDLK